MDIITGIISTVFIVSNPHSPLCINVGFLFNQPVGTFRDIPLVYDCLDIAEDAHLQNFAGNARITRTRGGMLFSVHVLAYVESQCALCLRDFKLPLETGFDELYAEDERSITESELLIPEDANIDLTPLVREYILLEMPISPACSPDCKGLCKVCGIDLNHAACEHQKAGSPIKTKPQAKDINETDTANPESPLARALRKALGESPTI